MSYFVNKINLAINKIIDRNRDRNNSFTSLLRRKIHMNVIDKIFNDKSLHFTDLESYWRFCCNFPKNEKNKLNLEFGTGSGVSGNFISSILENEKVYGFDSFDGFKKISKKSLWSKVNKKFLKRSKPIMNHNYIIIDGFVEDTIDEFEKTTLIILKFFYTFRC